MFDLAPLIKTFVGQSNAMASSATPDWQSELLKQLDPAYEKKQAIKKGLLAASQALMNTPGNFMTGVGQAASQGAGAYNDMRDNQHSRRIEALKLIDDSRRQQKVDSLSRLRDVIGIYRGANQDELSNKREDRLLDYYKGKGTGGVMADWQQQQVITAIENSANRKYEALIKDGTLLPEEAAAQVDSWKRAELQNRGFDPDTYVYIGRGNQPQSPPQQPAPKVQGNPNPELPVPPTPPGEVSITQPVPPQAIEFLRSHPEAASQFDAKYGQGLAARILHGVGG